MLTIRALFRASHESRITPVTAAPNALTSLLLDKVLASRARGHGQWCSWVTRVAQVRRKGRATSLAGADLRDLGLGDRGVFVWILFAGGRVAGTFLAAGVLAVDADLVGAEGGFAAVAGAADSHADGLRDAGELEIGRRFPLAGFQSKAVFGEEGAGLFLLDGAVVGDHCAHGGFCARGLTEGVGGRTREMC